MSIGILAPAFGQQRTNTAGPSNEEIGTVALLIKEMTGGVISTQWEVEAYLQSVGEAADNLVSGFKAESHYVTTQQVFDRSLAYFKSVGVMEIVIVAQPMHLMAIRLAMKGWDIDPSFHFSKEFDKLLRDIPFDDSEGNEQNWTRGPLRFGAYLVRAKLSGVHGK